MNFCVIPFVKAWMIFTSQCLQIPHWEHFHPSLSFCFHVAISFRNFFCFQVTIERDLEICRKLAEFPIVWDLLFLVASYYPAVHCCSIILRAVVANLIQFWSTRQVRIFLWFFFDLCYNLLNVMQYDYYRVADLRIGPSRCRRPRGLFISWAKANYSLFLFPWHMRSFLS